MEGVEPEAAGDARAVGIDPEEHVLRIREVAGGREQHADRVERAQRLRHTAQTDPRAPGFAAMPHA